MTLSTARSHGSHRATTATSRARRATAVLTTVAVAFGSVLALGALDSADAASTVVAQDDFASARPSGWTNADVGGAYAYSTTRGITGTAGQGIIDLTRAGEDRTVTLPSVSARDVTLSTSSLLPVRPTTGSGVRYALRVRKSGNTSYDAVVRVMPTGTTLLSLSRVEANGSRTRLTNDVQLAARTDSATTLRLAVTAAGTSPVALSAQATLVESTTSTSAVAVKPATAQSAAAVAKAKRVVIRAAKAVKKARSTKARTKARKKLSRARAGLAAARRAHASARSSREFTTRTTTSDKVTATREVKATDSSAQRITGAGQVGVWAYTSTDTPAARIALTALKAVADTAPAATPPPPAQVPVPNKAPTAAFTPVSTSKSLTASFDAASSTDSDGALKSYAWSFGDGGTATGVKTQHTYAEAGTYTVSLTVTDDDGATSTTTRSVTVTRPNLAPVAAFSTTQRDLDVAFDASTSSDVDGDVVSRTWDFGDGTSAEGTTTAHRYPKAGTYRATLTVTDDDGATATSTRSLVVTDPPPPNRVPTATFTDTTARKSLTASFDATDSADADGTVESYAWTFGDGSRATGAKVEHSYARAGSYVVALTVTDDDGAASTTTRTVTVTEPNQVPIATFVSTQKDLTASFDGTSSTDVDGTVRTYAWRFGDGSTGTGATVTRTYAKAGTYSVTLTVTDDDGATSTRSRDVTVTAPVATPGTVKPSAATTGVPAGTKLTRYDGSMTITKAGTVVDGLDIYGNVTVKAANVVIRNSRVHGAPSSFATGLITNYGYANLLIEDTYISPDQPSVTLDGIKGSDYTARRVHVVGGVDSAKVQGDNVRIEDSLLENTNYFTSDPYQNGGPTHSDNVQIQRGRNIVISGNTIRGAQNFAVLGAASIGDTPGLRVTGNWVNDGHCTMKFEQYKTYKLSVLVKDNKFGPDRKVRSCPMVATPDSDFTPENNVWESNGQPVPYLRVANG